MVVHRGASFHTLRGLCSLSNNERTTDRNLIHAGFDRRPRPQSMARAMAAATNNNSIQSAMPAMPAVAKLPYTPSSELSLSGLLGLCTPLASAECIPL